VRSISAFVNIVVLDVFFISASNKQSKQNYENII